MATFEGLCSNGHHYIIFNVWEISTDVGSNTSKVGWSIQMRANPSWGFYTIGSTIVAKIDGQQVYNEYAQRSCDAGSTVTWASGEATIGHNSDGTKTAYCECSYSQSSTASYTPGNGSASGNIPLSTIPRYANITSFSVSQRNETSLTVNFGVDSTIDYCQYALNNGSWHDSGVSASSRSFNITGLSANTSYNVKIRVRRQDSQLWTESSNKPQTTHDYPKCTNSPDFVIGNSVTLTLYNPLGRSVTVKILSSSDVELASGTTSGTSISGFNGASQIQNMYNSIPNSATGTYKVKVTYGSTNKIRNNGNTYSVNTDTSKPTFNLFEYADINATTTALTGDNQVCVIGYSTIQATISTSNKATANNSATMSKYRLTIGNFTDEVNYSASETVTMQIAKAISNTYTVYAVDSRGLTKPVSLTSTGINYTNIIKDVNNSSVLRTNGVSDSVNLILNGSIWYGNFGQVNNTIDSVTYRLKKTTASQWTTGTTTITPTVNNDGTFEFEGIIAGDTNNGFDIESSYNIEVEVSDKLSTATYTFTLGSGKPHVAYYKDGVSIMGAYDETLGGCLQVNGVIRDGIYTFSEKKIGRYWGKPLYRQLIQINTRMDSSVQIFTYDLGSSLYNTVNRIWLDSSHSHCYLYNGGSDYPIPVPYFDGTYHIAVKFQRVRTSSKLYITINKSTYFDIYGMTLAIEYTKSTD